MKKYLSLFLCVVLLLGVFAAAPAAFAADDAGGEPENDYPIPGQEFTYLTKNAYATSELEDGVCYYARQSITLTLDADRTCPVIYTEGNLTIKGTATLTCEILYAEGSATLKSGVVVCPVMNNPPDDDTLLINGLRGIQGVSISGGSITCQRISGSAETVSVTGGEVHAGSIGAIFGYLQSGGIVEVSSIWGREGVYVSGGTLTVGRVEHDFSFEISFPMVITEPSGAVYLEETGRFVDAAGKPLDRVTISEVKVDLPFTDVQPNAWYQKPVAWAVYKGINKGTDRTHFSPKDVCTRAQTVTFLWRASGCPAPKTATCGFADVAEDAWYRSAVLWAVETGVTKGTDKTHFSPDETCTRAQALTFLWRSRGLKPTPYDLDSLVFQDVSPDAYYASAVSWGTRSRIVNGTGNGRFSPDAFCTRAALVTFLYRAS